MPAIPARSTGRLLALLAAAALTASACGNATGQAESPAPPPAGGGGGPNTAPGVTDTEIRYAALGTRSNNPLGTCVLDCFTNGINAYFAYRNSQGGVHGRQLKLTTVLDDELANNQAKALEIVSADDTFGTFSAAQLASGWSDIANAGIPLYVWAINFNEMNGHDNIWGNAGVTCAACIQKSEVYAASLAQARNIASLGYGITQNSKDCVAEQTKAVERYGPTKGQKVAYKNDNLAFGLSNGVGPEVTAMKQADVDFIMTCIDLNGVKTLAQELERQGMGNVPVLHANTYDQDFVKAAGNLFEGDIVAVRYRPFEADPGRSQLQDFLDWMGKANQKPSELAYVGWINADLAYEGLKAAGPQFDRAGVVAATNKLTAFTAGGLINPIDWSRQHELPTDDDPVTNGYAKECTAFVRVKGGRFELVGDKAKPFSCWDNRALGQWSEPQATDVG
jgi:ABC-type branched-subunit amino acid transport system substrate-binding protein